MRKPTKMEKPVFLPYTCISCGLGAGPSREWFVDLGIDIGPYLKDNFEGNVYLCNECLPGFTDELIKIISEWRREVMDNNLLKEEATYGLMDRFAVGSELPAIHSGESESEVSGTGRDNRDIQILVTEEDVPDTGHSSSAEANSGVDDPTERVDPTTGELKTPTITTTPIFHGGRRIS